MLEREFVCKLCVFISQGIIIFSREKKNHDGIFYFFFFEHAFRYSFKCRAASFSLKRFSPFDTISALHIIFCEYSDSSRVFCSRRIYTMGPIKIPQKLCIALLIHPSKSSKGTLQLLRKHEWLGRWFRKWQFLPTLCYVNLFLIHPSKS